MRLAILGVATAIAVAITSPGQAARFPGTVPADTTAEARHQLVQELLNRLGDRDTLPVDSVYDVEVIDGSMPARKFLALMDSYGAALGVNCTYCHVPGRYSREDSVQKEVTRKMVTMMDTINVHFLGTIRNLSDTGVRIDCVTCHRGHIRPTLSPDTVAP